MRIYTTKVKEQKKMKNEENWTKMKKNEENENQIGAINHSQTLVILLLQNS